MKREDFLNELAEALEIEESINEQTELQIDSMAVLVLISFLDENFDMQVKADQLKEIQKVSDLITLIGADRIS